MQKHEIQFVITDIDGTIINRMPVLRATFAEMVLRYYGIPADVAGKYYYESAGIFLTEQLKGLLGIYKISFTEEEIKNFLAEFILLSQKTKPEPFSGAAETLKKIKETGRYLLASSGSPTAELEKLFADYGLPYDFVIGSDIVLKGDRHIEMLADHFLLPKSEFCRQALLIGDGGPDIELGKRNGIFTLGIANTISAEKLLAVGADVVITDIRDLLNHLQ